MRGLSELVARKIFLDSYKVTESNRFADEFVTRKRTIAEYPGVDN